MINRITGRTENANHQIVIGMLSLWVAIEAKVAVTIMCDSTKSGKEL
jgi:hypothetical protein